VTAEQSRVLQIWPRRLPRVRRRRRRSWPKLHLIEAARTPGQAEQAMADDVDETIFIYRKVIGAGFTAQALP